MGRPAQATSDVESLSDLVWAHETLMRLMAVVQRNGLMGPRLSECVAKIGTGAILLEGVIQELAIHARRRKED